MPHHARVTYCRICEAACGLLADVDGDRVVALRPDRDHVVSRGFACAKGTRFAELHTSPSRVDHPMVRDGGKLVRTSWEQANRDIGRTLRRLRDEHGPHATAVYVGNPAAFSYTLPLYAMGLIRALGTRNYFSAGSQDCNNKFVVARRMLGSAATHPVPDLERADFALLVGTNPSVSQSSFVNAPRMVERLQAIERRGGQVVVVDPRRSETARAVGQHVPIVPDTDAALLLALLATIFEERLEHAETLARHAKDVSKLREAVRGFSPERVAPLTGVAAATTRDIARRFARAKGAFCHVSTGVNQGRFGNIAYAAKLALELCTGNLDREGGALMVRGAVDTAAIARLVGLDSEPPWRSRVGSHAPVLGTLPASILADEILTPGREKVRALIVIAGNPLLSAPAEDRLREAFGKLELLVSIDLFVNDTGAHATHVLPSTDFLEREDLPLSQLQLQPSPYLQWTDAVVAPRGERRQDYRIFLGLCRAAKLPFFGSHVADRALRAALALGGPRSMLAPLLVPALGLRPLAKLRAHPHGVSLAHRERPGDFLRRRIRTASRRVELFDAEVWARLDELSADVERGACSGLRLISKRERLGHNSWMHDSARLALPVHAAHLSTEDARRLGVTRGDRVRLSANGRQIELPVAIDPELRPGAVAVPHGYGHDPGSSWTVARARGGANVNRLAASGSAAVDPLSGMTQLVGIPVHIQIVRPRDEAEAQAREP